VIRRRAQTCLTQAEAAEAFVDLPDRNRLLIAVSGGPDSMALMALLAAWRGNDPALPVLYAATVDHGLRDGSAGEAAMAAAEAARLGLRHATLRWMGEKPGTGLAEAARKARYALLAAEARRIGARCIVTAHTMDDQAETVLMRFLRGSGPAGLAGMARRAQRGGLTHWRPLLGIRKARLVATCTAMGVPYAVDPTNEDERYARPRLRKLLDTLAPEGVSVERLARLAERQARANLSLTLQAIAALGPAEPVAGGLRFWRHDLARVQPETQIRALMLAFERARQALDPSDAEAFFAEDAPLPLEKLETAMSRIDKALSEQRPCTLTLGGFAVSIMKDRSLKVVRERPRRHIHPVHPPSLGKGGDEA
jgi:tRNA(Ile)-lysidine synthase